MRKHVLVQAIALALGGAMLTGCGGGGGSTPASSTSSTDSTSPTVQVAGQSFVYNDGYNETTIVQFHADGTADEWRSHSTTPGGTASRTHLKWNWTLSGDTITTTGDAPTATIKLLGESNGLYTASIIHAGEGQSVTMTRTQAFTEADVANKRSAIESNSQYSDHGFFNADHSGYYVDRSNNQCAFNWTISEGVLSMDYAANCDISSIAETHAQIYRLPDHGGTMPLATISLAQNAQIINSVGPGFILLINQGDSSTHAATVDVSGTWSAALSAAECPTVAATGQITLTASNGTLSDATLSGAKNVYDPYHQLGSVACRLTPTGTSTTIFTTARTNPITETDFINLLVEQQGGGAVASDFSIAYFTSNKVVYRYDGPASNGGVTGVTPTFLISLTR